MESGIKELETRVNIVLTSIQAQSDREMLAGNPSVKLEHRPSLSAGYKPNLATESRLEQAVINPWLGNMVSYLSAYIFVS